ncbi:pyocin knob domain-containing protein [Serratia quinivorans]
MSENNYAALMMKRAPTNSESWNNLKDPGIYPIAAGHPSAPDGAAGVLFVMPPKSGATQDFISTSKKRSIRTFANGAWLPWSTSLYVGDFGLAPYLSSLSGVDLNTLNSFGFYVVRDSTNTPLNDSSVWFLSVRTWDSKSAGDPFRIIQIAEGYGTSGTLKNRTFHRTYSGNAAGWSAWVEFYSEAHKPSASDVGLGNVGNFMAVQQGGATGMLANKVYLGWSSNKGLIGHVDSTALGSIYCELHKPTAAEVGAYPITGGVLKGPINALGSVGTQGGAFLIRNADGVQVASVSAGNDGAITVYSDVTGRSFGFDGFGNFTTAAGGFVCELGQRVYSPNNPQPIVQLNQDNIGSLAFARLNPQNNSVSYGGLVAGGSLSPSGVTGYPEGGGNWAALNAQQSTLPGTWKCLGLCISDTEGGNRHYGVSLFVRVS